MEELLVLCCNYGRHEESTVLDGRYPRRDQCHHGRIPGVHDTGCGKWFVVLCRAGLPARWLYIRAGLLPQEVPGPAETLKNNCPTSAEGCGAFRVPDGAIGKLKVN